MNETMKEYIKITRVVMIILLVVILICPARIWAQNIELTNYERDTLISAAKELMATGNGANGRHNLCRITIFE